MMTVSANDFLSLLYAFALDFNSRFTCLLVYLVQDGL